MPIVTNHKGPGFREYNRTPAEKKLVELESKVSKLEQLIAQQSKDIPDDDEKPSE